MKSEIPNIIGENARYAGATGAAATGAFYNNNKLYAQRGGGTSDMCAVNFDASLSCDRYGTYTEVNPLYNSCKFIIRH